MRIKTHELVGLGFGLCAAMNCQVFNIEPSIINQTTLVAGSLLGAAIVDIDHTGSTAGRKAPFVSWPIAMLHKFFAFLGRHMPSVFGKFFKYLASWFGHRGIIHSGILWGALMVLNMLYLDSFVTIICTGIVVGAFSHLVADTFNPTGIPWLMPIVSKKLSIAKIRTGSKQETIFCGVVVVIDILILFIFLKGAF